VSSEKPRFRLAFILTGLLSLVCLIWQARTMKAAPTAQEIAQEIQRLQGDKKAPPSSSASASEIAKLVVQQLPKKDPSKFSTMTNERLIELAKSTSQALKFSAGQWQGQMIDDNVRTHDRMRMPVVPVPGAPNRVMNDEEKENEKKAAQLRAENIGNAVRNRTKSIALEACDLRIEFLSNRLQPSEIDAPDNGNQQLFARLKSGNYSWQDMQVAGNYLSELESKLEGPKVAAFKSPTTH
jgi:hypothetical protein